MNKYFYSHLIEIESLIVELDMLELEPHEKMHLAQLLDANLHNTILDAVLSELSEKDKEIFLKLLQEGDHEKVWGHLSGRIKDVEEKIKKAADQLKEDMHKDIEASKKLKTNS